VGCHGGNEWDGIFDEMDPVATARAGGQAVYKKKYRIEAIPDGSSNQIAIGERCSQKNVATTTRQPLAAVWAGIDGNEASANGGSQDTVGEYAILGMTSVRMTDGYDAGTDATPYFPYRGFNSLHTGGCNVGMLDGSVRFVSENISFVGAAQSTYDKKGTWERAGAREDGNPLGSDW